MPTVLKRGARSPISNFRVLGTPTPAAKTPAKAKPAPAKPAARSKVFTSLADALAQIAGVIKGVRERERDGKIPAGTANKLSAQLGEFMTIAEGLGAAEASARLNAIAEEAQKASRHQPAARITQVAPAVTVNGAHALRGALGLRSTPEQSEKTAREMTERRRAEGSGTGHPGRPVDLPAAAKPTHVNALTTTVVTYGPNGQRLPETPIANALVWQHTYGRYIAAGQRAVTISAAEVGRATGLTVAQVNQAVAALEASGQLVRQPGRLGSVPLFAPAAI